MRIELRSPLRAIVREARGKLTHGFQDARIAHIEIHTKRQAIRSVHTGLPLSALTGVEITVERRTTEPEAMDALIAALLERHAGDTAIMIVGHSNTIPELLVRLGATPACYDRLGIVDHGNYLLIEGYEGLYRATATLSKRKRQALECVIEMYDRWHAEEPHAGHDTKAAAWRAKLEPD